jgi:hypothetical protein
MFHSCLVRGDEVSDVRVKRDLKMVTCCFFRFSFHFSCFPFFKIDTMRWGASFIRQSLVVGGDKWLTFVFAWLREKSFFFVCSAFPSFLS